MKTVHFVGEINGTRYRLTAYVKDLDLVKYDNTTSLEINVDNLNQFNIETIEIWEE